VSDNPYQSPSDDTLSAELWTIGLRWYHVPFLIALACGVAVAVTYCVNFQHPKVFAACLAICGIILLYDLPVCGIVLCEWRRTGEAPKFSFMSLFGAESRALRRTLQQRPPLDDDTFYVTYYADSGITQEIVVGVRRELQRMLGHCLAGVYPSDRMSTLEPDADCADIFDELAEAFSIVIP
jgi:hypothetical protein